ncbi:hypothetical protein [Sphingobacterium sp. JB170]|uniref:DUF7674 family protein n=1 Tax=Sphingobacterium sp. JB170 TaxID=1434842 RepID=UPI00097F3CF3|nr:hypothetical protein [Sphingobacterium sp. JB170]SJN46846.1 hypothetical protein FM107_15040 [Sphingobacterium sp. JB170]
MDKLSENRASAYLAFHYGDIKEEINKLSTRKNFAGILQAIVNHINILLTNGQAEKIGVRIKIIGCLYKRGNEYVQYLVENLFVRSFTGMKRRCTAEQWAYVYQTIPKNLKNIYQLQTKNNLTQNINL